MRLLQVESLPIIGFFYFPGRCFYFSFYFPSQVLLTPPGLGKSLVIAVTTLPIIPHTQSRLPMASTCRCHDTTLEDFLWSLEPTLCTSRAGQNIWGINVPRISVQQMTDKIWWKLVYLGWSNSEVPPLLYPRAEGLSSHNSNLLNFFCVTGFLPFLISLPTTLPILLGITSQINYLCSHPCLRVCFCRNQMKRW